MCVFDDFDCVDGCGDMFFVVCGECVIDDFYVGVCVYVFE